MTRHKAFLLWLALTLASRAGFSVGAAAPSSRAMAEFAAARMAQSESLFGEALEGYARAVALDPKAVYLRVEHALVLLEAAQEDNAQRPARLALAAEEAEAAAHLDPGNPEALRVLAQVKLEMAEQSPARRDEAREALRALVAVRPGDLGAALALGRLLLQDGEAAEAAQALRGVLRRHPGQREASGLLIEAVRLAAGRDSAAQLGALETELAAQPGLLLARLALAEASRESGDPQAAISRLQAAPAEQRDDPDLLYQRALARFRALDFAAALQDLAAAQDEIAERDRVFLLADVSAADGRFDQAIQPLAAWVEQHPEDVEAAVGLARVEALGGRAAAAVDRMMLAASRAEAAGRPGQAMALLLRAALFSADVEAWSEVERALAAVPVPAAGVTVAPGVMARQEEVLVLRAEALARKNRLTEALALLETGAASPEGVLLRAKRAELLYRQGRRDEARDILTGLAAGDARSAVVAGEAWQRLNRHREAVSALDRALALDANSVEAAFRRASSLERLGRRRAAITAFRALLERAPSFAPAANYLAYTWAEAGEELVEAERWARRATALDPASAAYADTLGWALFRLGDHAAARRELERAARLLPRDATIAVHLGECREASGDLAGALAKYRQALDLGLEDPAAARRLRRRVAALSSRVASSGPSG